MQIKTTLVTALLSATAFAAPAPAPEVQSMMAAAPEWTIAGAKRTCDAGDNSCTWNFKVDTHLAPATACSFTVKRGAKPASQTDSSNNKCGPYTVGSGWDGSFGPGQGFTVLSVADYSKKLIVWPGYTDKELAGGKVVVPDKAYAPAKLP